MTITSVAIFRETWYFLPMILVAIAGILLLTDAEYNILVYELYLNK